MEKFTIMELSIALRVAMAISDHADECSMHPDMRIASECANLLNDYAMYLQGRHCGWDPERKKFVKELIR